MKNKRGGAAAAPANEDIAVIGLGCLYPGAPDIETYWQNIVGKLSAITDPPPEAWDQELYYDATSTENDRVYCKKGGYLGPLALFDPIEHGIMPRAVEGGEPDQWLALHVARQALRDAGYVDGGPHGQRTALILGKGTYANRGTISVVHHGVVVDYTLQLLKSIHPELTPEDLQAVRQDLKRSLPRFDAETAPALIPNVAVGRIANRLDMMGPSYTIDAACASSLVAIDIAVKGLRQGEYDLAMVGGMQVATPVPVLSLFCRLNALSATQTIRPFDKDADGTLLSEGIGMAVLKRHSDAVRDGDRIYAVVKGCGVASDGRGVSVLAPRVEGEELAVRQAYASAGVAPQTVGLVEAHGTATLVGDAVEVEALGRVFGARTGAARVALGSVKSMIGHTMPAAGMAGFIKAALALHHKVLPPTLGVTEPSPRLKLEQTPFYINTETRPWIHGDAAHRRRAGVNAFGFGGINAHVILEEAGPEGAVTFDRTWDAEVFLLSGATRQEVVTQANQLSAAAARRTDVTLADLAWSLNTTYARSQPGDLVVGIVATSRADLTRKLARVAARLPEESCRRIKEVTGIYFAAEPLAPAGKLAVLFPGEGAQYVNMLADLCRHFPEVRQCFDRMDSHFVGHPRGYVLSDVVYPPPFFTAAARQEAEQRLWQMGVAVEALYTANQAVFTLLTELGLKPDALLGHSTGEYSAFRAAGMLDQARYEARLNEMHGLYEGATSDGTLPTRARLIAVGAGRESVDAICARFDKDVWVAMDNCPHQLVLVARPQAADALEGMLRAEGLLHEVLAFDRPVHTPAFTEYANELDRFFKELVIRPPAIPVYSATSTRVYPAAMPEVHELAYEHWRRPVEFRQTIDNMYDDGVRLFVESGPRGNLTSFVDDILGRRRYAAIPANVTRHSDITQISHLVAQLAAQGVKLTLDVLYRRRQVNAIDLTADVRPASSRPLGRVKIPTGAPNMRLSPEVAARIRARAKGSSATNSTTPLLSPAAAALAPVTNAAALAMPAMAKPGRNGALSTAAVAAVPAPAVEPVASVPAAAIADPAAPTAPSGHPDVLAAYMGTMQSFLQLQHDVMADVLGGGYRQPEAADASLPFIETVLAHQPGQAIIARCTLDLASCPCLADHTLGRHVSIDDPALPAFPVIPFTLMMEIMSEAAIAVGPELLLTGMRNVRVHRWVAVDPGPVTLEVRAERVGDGAIAVRLFEPDGNAMPVGEATMLVADAYAPPPVAAPLLLPDGQAFRLTPERLYAEAMFHGPAFRGVRSIDRVGETGASASLVVLDRGELLSGGRAAGLVTDFVTLDLPGQVVGFWAAQFLRDGFLVLPFSMDALSLYGPPLPAGEQVTCVARIALRGEHDVTSSLDVVRADGTLWARFDGWDDRRFDLPAAVRGMLLSPQGARLSEAWDPGMGALPPAQFAAARVGGHLLPTSWLGAHGGLWTRVVAANVLGRRERELWRAIKLPPPRRIEWLFGRIAAKDAVRDLLRARFGVSVCPADVEILPDADGRPTAQGGWLDLLPRPPHVSISHVEGTAVAIAGDGEHVLGLGVDLERLGRMKPEMAHVAFSARELLLLDGVDVVEREAWLLRLWCAKEACAKAVGKGLLPASSAFAIQQVDLQDGAVSIRFDAPDVTGRDLVATTARDGEWVVAMCGATAEGYIG